MAEGTVGAINVEIRAKADQLDRDLRVGERKVIDSSNKMGKSMEQAFNFSAFIAGLTALASAGTVALNTFDLITARIKGNLKESDEAAASLEQSMRAIPILGQVFGLGNSMGEKIFGDKADAAETQRAGAESERRRITMLKQQEEALKRIKTLTRETALLGAADDAERLKLQAQFKLEDATSGIQGATPDKLEEIQRLANLRFKLETAAKDAGVGSGSQISARTSLSTKPPDQQQPNKKQVDLTNQLLQNIVRVIAGLDNRTVAQ